MSRLQIRTRYGVVEGTESNGIGVWKGIPYGKPPIGPLRFQAPQPPEVWEGIRTATSFGPCSMQPGGGAEGLFGMAEAAVFSEDCLYLNIWAPREVPEEGLPVMVWIHGGAFVNGSSSLSLYDGESFVKSGKVIVVSINYRLGPFGFLHVSPLGEGFVSNAGLLDQAAALKWVQDNIAAFGGDASRVTVFGESAGSMSVAALLAMPAATGLFRQAILQSGASQVLPQQQAGAIAGGMLKLLGLTPADADKLKSLPAELILEAGEKLKAQHGGGLAMLFQPVVDGSVLEQEPLAAIIGGAAKGIPLIIGTNHDEGAMFIRPDDKPLPADLVIPMMEMMTGSKGAADLVKAYPNSAEGQAQALTDLYFWRSSLLFAAAQSAHAPVWMYRFDWTLAGHPLLGKAIHAGEIAFFFIIWRC